MLTKVNRLCEQGGVRVSSLCAAKVSDLREKINTLTDDVDGKDVQL